MTHRPLFAWFFVVAVSALAVDAVWAQPPGGPGGRGPGGFGGRGPGGGGPGGGSDLMLLGNEQVQKELELLPDQVADLTKIREESSNQMRESFSGFRDLSQEDREKRMAEMRSKMEESQKAQREKIANVLLPHQLDRLKEISLQLRGPAALEDPEVASALKITDEQKQKITSTREAQREKVSAMFRDGGGGGDRDAMREKFTALRQENEAQLLAVLTPDQAAQFEKMKGEKANIDLSQIGRGGPGGGAPGGGFGGRGPGGSRFGGNRGEGGRPGERGSRGPGDRGPRGTRPSGDAPRPNSDGN